MLAAEPPLMLKRPVHMARALSSSVCEPIGHETTGRQGSAGPCPSKFGVVRELQYDRKPGTYKSDLVKLVLYGLTAAPTAPVHSRANSFRLVVGLGIQCQRQWNFI